MNIYCCCLHKVNKLTEIKNEPRDLLPNVNKGKTRMLIPNFALNNFSYEYLLLLLFTYSKQIGGN